MLDCRQTHFYCSQLVVTTYNTLKLELEHILDKIQIN